MRSDFVLRGDIAYCRDKDHLETLNNGYLVCVDGRCAGVYEELPDKYSKLPLEDWRDHLIIPAMTDLHTHAPQYEYRGTGMDLELMEWLSIYTYPVEGRYDDPQYARKGYGLFADAMRKSATGRVCIFATSSSRGTRVLMDCMEKTGLVSYVGKVNMDRLAPDGVREENASKAAQDTAEWIRDTRSAYERTFPIITPRFVPSCTDDLMQKLGEIAEIYHMPVQSHLSENRAEIKLVESLCPSSRFYGEAYSKWGLFGSTGPTVMAHCVYSTDEELALMKRNNVFIAHCPTSNMNVSTGIAPVKRYLEMGMPIGLGSDTAGGQTESLFQAMTDAIRVSKLYNQYVDSGKKPLTFAEAFYMATLGGGAFFGKVGTFQEGYEFDAIVLDDASVPWMEKPDIAHRLERAVYLNMDAAHIRAKFVAGDPIQL